MRSTIPDNKEPSQGAKDALRGFFFMVIYVANAARKRNSALPLLVEGGYTFNSLEYLRKIFGGKFDSSVLIHMDYFSGCCIHGADLIFFHCVIFLS